MVQTFQKYLVLPLFLGAGALAQADENLDNLAFLTLFNNIETVSVSSATQIWPGNLPLAARVMPLIRKPTNGAKRSSMETTCSPTSATTAACVTHLRIKAGTNETAFQDYKYEYRYNLVIGPQGQGGIFDPATEVVTTAMPDALLGQFPTVQSEKADRIASATLKKLVVGAENMEINVGQAQNVDLNLFLLKQMKPQNPGTERVYSTMSSTASDVTATTAKVELKVQTYLYNLSNGAETPAANGEKTIKARATVENYVLDPVDAKKDAVEVNEVLTLIP